MISKLLYTIQRALVYSRKHPQLLFVLTLLFLLPLLFLYSGQQFLEAGKANHDQVQKDRIGLLHDSFVSMIVLHEDDLAPVRTQLRELTAHNPDIVDFKITKLEQGDIVTKAALTNETENRVLEYSDLYRSAAVRSDESIIYEVHEASGRQWYGYRAIETTPGEFYFIFTQTSLAAADAVFKERERSALYSLFFVYVFIIGLAYWHLRLTDYRYLYHKVREANEMKDLFTNMIAHELRTPLTAIQGYASLLEETSTDPSRREQAQRIRHSSKRLLTIVSDLLDVARIQSGKLQMSKREVNVSQVILSVVGELQPLAVKQEIPLYHTGTDVPHIIVADEIRLQQALVNVVSNAVKYTPDGKIEIAVSSEYGWTEVRVKDTGMGISADDQKELFAPFFRVSRADVSKITGTGLGMWISKHLVELMGGSIMVESIRGVGTHIVIKFKEEN